MNFTSGKADYMLADDGAYVYYRTCGEGPAIVLIHGLLVNTKFWEQNIKVLSEKFQVVSIDMRGHGFTKDEHIGNYSLERVAKDVDQLISHLKLKDVTLTGWSTGSFVIYSYITLFGAENIKGVCMVDMPPKMISDESWEYGGFDAAAMEQTIAGISAADFEVRKQFVPAVYASDAQLDGPLYDFTLENFMLSPSEAFIGFMRDLTAYDYRELVKEFPVPMLFCCGEKNLLYPKSAAGWMEESMNNEHKNRVVQFFESGHGLQIEEATKFNRVLRDFVQELHS